MSLRDPWYLLLLLLLPLLVWYLRARPERRGLSFPAAAAMGNSLGPTLRNRLYPLLPALRLLAIALAIVALARPQQGLQRVHTQQKGVDIILTVDVSTSMLAEDFTINGRRQNRLDVVKVVVGDFIDQRPQDRLGMVIFGRHPYTLAPLTWDHDWLQNRLGDVRAGMVEDGTGIGAALSTALNRLKESKAKSKIVILLTDGVNNINTIAPTTAAQAAKALKVKVYTIGAGSSGRVPYPFQDQFGRTTYRDVQIDLDEELLKEIAAITGGRYFRATDTDSLREIYALINRLEKTEIETPQYLQYVDLYPFLLLPAIFLFLGEIVLRNTLLRRLP
ncbi:MAG: vWA domain-containing protein [Bacteroidota bacterium]